MKYTLVFSAIISILVALLDNCNSPSQQPSPQTTKTSNDSLKSRTVDTTCESCLPCEEIADSLFDKGVSVSCIDRCMMRGNISHLSGHSSIYDATVSVSNLVSYYYSTPTYGPDPGIRLYFVLDAGKKLYLMSCVANNSQKVLGVAGYSESRYVILNSTTIPSPLPSINSGRLNGDYERYEKIDGYNISHYPAIYCKNSRFYSWSELLSLFYENIPGFNINNPTYGDYKIVFEHGYIDDNMGNDYYNILRTYPEFNWVQDQITLVGHTVMLHLIDPDGYELTCRDNEFDPDEFSRAIREIGKPCPPYCGNYN